MTSSWKRRASELAAAALLLAAGLSASLPASAQAPEGGPELSIPIPGIEFSGIIRDGDAVTVPWLAQYISGMYVFLLSIVGFLAASMMIVGGFQFVSSGGDSAKAGAGKKKILNAMSGLVLAFGSYAILYAVNPALVKFEGLRLMGVKPSTYGDFGTTLGTTTVNTATGIQAGITETGGASGGTAGSHAWMTGACPFTLTQPKNSRAGRTEFYRAIASHSAITGTRAQRVVQIADLARVCGAMLGSCGRTAGAINAMAGVFEENPPWANCCLQEAECLASCEQYKNDSRTYARCKSTADNCNDNAKGREFYAITQKQRMFLYGLRCDTEGSASWPACSFSGPWPKSNSNCRRSDCVNTQAEAVAAVQRAFGTLEAVPELQPGDRLVVYNGNTDLVGAHAIIFMGWSPNNPNVMQTINGTAGLATFAGGVCVRQPCGTRPLYPIIYGWRP